MFKEFLEVAQEEINTIKQENQTLDEEEHRITTRLDEISKIRSEFVIDNNSLNAYISACPSNRYTCPICFIRIGTSIEMKPIPGDNDTDIFKCSHCSSFIEVKA